MYIKCGSNLECSTSDQASLELAEAILISSIFQLRHRKIRMLLLGTGRFSIAGRSSFECHMVLNVFLFLFYKVVAILGEAFPWKVESKNIDCKYHNNYHH